MPPEFLAELLARDTRVPGQKFCKKFGQRFAGVRGEVVDGM
jgi:hypothetical protein